MFQAISSNANVNCNKTLKSYVVKPKSCCSLPSLINEEMRSICQEHANIKGNSTKNSMNPLKKSHQKKHERNCYLQCFLNETGILVNNYEFNEQNMKIYLQNVLNKTPDYMPLYQQSFRKCYKHIRKNHDKKEEKKRRKKRSAAAAAHHHHRRNNNHCQRFGSMIMHCVIKKSVKSCPDNSWLNTKECNDLKEYLQTLKSFHIYHTPQQASTTSSSNYNGLMDSLEKEFQLYFLLLEKQYPLEKDKSDICRQFREFERWQLLKRWCCYRCIPILMMMMMMIGLLFWWYSDLEWFLSAIGRLFLIQLIPYWNWSTLYNENCLIETRSNAMTSMMTTNDALRSSEMEEENCVLCEFIDFIPTETNVTFIFIQQHYLETGVPVIILDSHQILHIEYLFDLIALKSRNFLKTRPCDVSTSLIIKKFFNIEAALLKAEKLLKYKEKKNWFFLQFRNCQFEAVKSARVFIMRPYYYPKHLSPAYTTWLLMSYNYKSKQLQILHTQGLIIIQQLLGTLVIELKAKEPCIVKCPNVHLLLKQGESLVFTTDLWILSYGFITEYSSSNTTSITTIMEIEWDV
uniref:OBP47-like domain-containing protein n=1 Tax=Glossina brevipalpis TaxID=37001 RepID=A0A1A9X3L2_9MUSC